MTRYIFIFIVLIHAVFFIPDKASFLTGRNIPHVSDAPCMVEDTLETVHRIREQSILSQRHNYSVTAGIRILFFWLSKDDVGEGYIQTGRMPGDQDTEIIQLVMGSDPAKAPRGINRWGAALETSRSQTGAGYFFGFIKASKGKSVSEMEGELQRESTDQDYYFESIVSRITGSGMQSITVPIHSPEDINLHQLPEAEEMVLQHISETETPSRFLSPDVIASCGNTDGMLFALQKMTSSAVNGEEAPMEQCYFYNSKPYLLRLKSYKPVPSKQISFKRRDRVDKTETAYENLISADFNIRNEETGDTAKFNMLIGTEDRFKGIPVQIRYQPNWWFRVVLNLDPYVENPD
jgi:hypothetical protein